MDLRTSLTHYLTPDAAAAGLRGLGHYVALCGADVLPASLADPGSGTCDECVRTSIPAHQRTAR